MPLMFTNREIAVADLKRARESFDSLLHDKTAPPLVRERALWGLALTLETVCDADTQKPIEAYERLLSDFPDTIFKSVAEERIRSLKKPSTRDFYSWFSKEKPKPPEARPLDIKPNKPEEDLEDFIPRPSASSKNSVEKNETPSEGDAKKDGAEKPVDQQGETKSEPEKPNSDKPSDQN
jgi:hypothetical protein